MSELINFRDFGGMKTKDGTSVRKGIFFRCGSYRDLTEEDRAFLKSLDIQNLFDYREVHEIDREEKKEEFARQVHNISASAHLKKHAVNDGVPFSVLTSESMKDFYRAIVFENPGYQNLFQVLRSEETVPMLHNCTHGKDRTGLGTALILLALNVPEPWIIHDYMLSMNAFSSIYANEVRRLKNGASEHQLITKLEGLIVMPDYLKASLNAIKEKYDSYDAFFHDEFGFEAKDLFDLRVKYTV